MFFLFVMDVLRQAFNSDSMRAGVISRKVMLFFVSSLRFAAAA